MTVRNPGAGGTTRSNASGHPARYRRFMSLHPRIPAAVFAVLVVLPAAPVPGQPSLDDEWIRVRTDHFHLFGNTGRQRAVAIGAHLERLRRLLPRTFPGHDSDSPLPTTIFLFRNEESFRPFQQGREGVHDTVRGYFVRARDGNYLAIDAADGGLPYGVISHEYLHFFLENRFPGIPLWLNEGLAELYSTVVFNGDGAELGHPIEAHLDWLSEHRMIPVEQLLTATTASSLYRGGDRRRTFYAQAWLLTHELMTGDDGTAARIDEYLDLLNRLPVATDAFFATFQTGPEALQGKLETHLRQESFGHIRVPMPGGNGTGAAQVSSLPRAELLFRLGDLLAHHTEVPVDRAEALLQESLRSGGPRADIHVSLGHLEVRRGNPRQAADWFEKAIDLDPDNARGYALYGWLVLKRLGSDGSRPEADPDGRMQNALEARRLFRRSLQMNPDDPESLAGFGKTFLFDPDGAEEGVRALDRAYRRLPARTDLLRDRILLLADLGETGRARSLLENELRPRAGDDELIRDAEEAIVNAEIGRAIDWFNAGDTDRAFAALDQLAGETRDPELLDRIDRTRRTFYDTSRTRAEVDLFNRAVEATNRQDLEHALRLFERVAREAESPELRREAATNVEDLRRVLHNNRLVERFNQAVDLANSGRPQRALEILEEILDSDPDPQLRLRIEDAAERIRSALGRP